MKRLFLILLVLLAGRASGQVLMADSVRSLGYSNQSIAMAHETNGRLYAFPDSGSAEGKRTLVVYSSDFGATWGVVLPSAWGSSPIYSDVSWAQNVSMVEDTVYLVSGTSGIATRISKIKNGAIVMIDTVGSIVQSYGYNLPFNYNADTPLVYVDAGADGVGDRGHFIAYGDGRLAAGVTWTAGTATTDTLITPANPVDRRCQVWTGFLRLDVSSTAAGDLYYIDKNTNKLLNGSFLRTEGDEFQNCRMAARDYNDTIVAFAWELADSITCRIGRINTADTSWTTISTTRLSTNARRHGNTEQKRGCAYVAWGGDSCYVFYKDWADTTNYDNASIMYRATGDNGANWSAERTLLAAVDGNDILMLNVPDRFDFSGDVDIVWCAYLTTANAASTNNMYFISDTVATAGAGGLRRRQLLMGD